MNKCNCESRSDIYSTVLCFTGEKRDGGAEVCRSSLLPQPTKTVHRSDLTHLILLWKLSNPVLVPAHESTGVPQFSPMSPFMWMGRCQWQDPVNRLNGTGRQKGFWTRQQNWACCSMFFSFLLPFHPPPPPKKNTPAAS